MPLLTPPTTPAVALTLAPAPVFIDAFADTWAQVPPGTLTWGMVGHAHMRPEAHSSTASGSSQGAGAVVMKDPEVNISEDKVGKERKQKKSNKEGDKKSTKKARLA